MNSLKVAIKSKPLIELIPFFFVNGIRVLVQAAIIEKFLVLIAWEIAYGESFFFALPYFDPVAAENTTSSMKMKLFESVSQEISAKRSSSIFFLN